MNGIFGNLFDFNRDGRIDSIEKGLEFQFLNERTQFERSGLNARDLEFMNSSDRRRTLRNAGLNPDEYDF